MEGENNNRDALSRESCLRFEADIPAYLEGESRPEFLAHAGECEFCRCTLADIEQIRNLSSKIGLESPPPAVWNRVRAVLIAEGVITKRRRFWQRWIPGTTLTTLRSAFPLGALAAAALAAVVLIKFPGHAVRPQVSRVPAVRAAVQEYMAPADAAELKRAIQQLEQAYYANESQLEPSVKETYRKGLASLNYEIRECEVMMQQDPENGLARQYLSTAYTQKAQLLQSALEFDLR
jgi:hypothetical protein